MKSPILLLGLLMMLAVGNREVSARPAVGMRAAGDPDMSEIPNEEAMGQPIDQVMEPVAPPVQFIDEVDGSKLDAVPDTQSRSVHGDAFMNDLMASAGRPSNLNDISGFPGSGSGFHNDLADKIRADHAKKVDEFFSPPADVQDNGEGSEVKTRTQAGTRTETKTHTETGTGSGSNSHWDQVVDDAKDHDDRKAEQGAKDAKTVVGMGLVMMIVIIVIVIAIVVGICVLIWWCVRRMQKKDLRAQGFNAEVKSVTPVVTAGGQAAEVVEIQPLSEGGSTPAAPSEGGSAR